MEQMKEEDRISYLHPRDLVIKSWGDRPRAILNQCRSIFTGLTSTSSTMLHNMEDSVLFNKKLTVYLRIKPGDNDGECLYNVIDEQTLQTTAAIDSNNYKNINRGIGQQMTNFTFSLVLREDTDQKKVFDKCVLQPLQQFLTGENRLLFVYGTTSAGKTYTMQGDNTNPGVFPRSIDYLFNQIKNNMARDVKLQPQRVNELSLVSQEEYSKELDFKNLLLNIDLEEYQKHPELFQSRRVENSSGNYSNATFREMKSQLHEYNETMFSQDNSDEFTVWISMIEIYNEQIYDLLQKYDVRASRQCLSIGEDKVGLAYVKDSRQINVLSADEAFQVFAFGRTNLHLAPTDLNNRSSRSHCICTITLARHLRNDSFAVISRFSFCDLAGSERAKKTQNIGERLAESKMINKSLLTLGKCLRITNENQKSKFQHIIPYRESKLTHLFKNALTGDQKLSMIVNISKNPYLYDETFHVLKFSAIARQVVENVFRRPKLVRNMGKSRFSLIVAKNKAAGCSTTNWESVSDDLTASTASGELEKQLLEQIEDLKKQLEEAKQESKDIESKTRQLVVAECRKIMERSTATKSEELRQLHKELEDKERKLKLYECPEFKRKRPLLDETRSEGEEVTRRELMEELRTMKNRYSALKSKLKDIKNDNNSLQMTCRSQEFELSDCRRQINMKSLMTAPECEETTQRLKDELAKNRSKIEDLKGLLDDATSEYSALEENYEFIKSEKDEIEAAHKQQINELNEELESLKFELDELRIDNCNVETYKNEMIELNELISKQKHELKVKQTELSKMKDDVRLVTEENVALSSKNNEIVESLRNKLTEMKENEEKCAILTEHEVEMKQIITNLENELKVVKEQFERTVCNYNGVRLELEEKLNLLEQIFNESEKDLRSKLMVSKEENEKLRSCLNVVEGELSEKRKDVAKLEVELNGKVAVLESLKEDMGLLVKEMEVINAEMNNLKGELMQVKKIWENSNTEGLEEKEIELRRLEIKLKELEEENETIKVGNNLLLTEKERKEGEIRNLKEELTCVKVDLVGNGALREEVEFTNLEKDVERITKEKERYMKDVNNIKKELEEKDNELTSLSKEIKTQETQIKKFKEDLALVVKEIAIKEDIIVQRENVITEMKEENEGLKKQSEERQEDDILKNKIKILEDEKLLHDSSVELKIEEIRNLKKEIEELTEEIESLRRDSKEKDENPDLISQIKSLECEKENLTQNTSSFIKDLQGKNKEITDLKKELIQLKEENEKLIEDANFVKNNRVKKEFVKCEDVKNLRKELSLMAIDFKENGLTPEPSKFNKSYKCKTDVVKSERTESIHPSGRTTRGRKKKKDEDKPHESEVVVCKSKKKLFKENDLSKELDLESSFVEDVPTQRVLRNKNRKM